MWSSRSPLDGAVCLRFSVSLESQHHTRVNSNAACMQQTQSNQTLSHLTSPAHSTSWMLVHVFYMLYALYAWTICVRSRVFIPGNVAVSHCLSIRLVPFSVPVLPEQVDAALCFHVINHCSRTWACNDTRRTIAFLCTAAKLEVNGRSQTALPHPPTVSSFSYLSISASSTAALSSFPGGRGLCGLGGGRGIRFAARLWLCAYKFGIKDKFPTGLCGICCCRLTV